MKGANKKIINIVKKQGELLKKFKEEDDIYFKIRLYKFLCKLPVLKNSTLTSSYFQSNFKLIKKVFKANANPFREKK